MKNQGWSGRAAWGLTLLGALLLAGGGYLAAHSMWLSATPAWETHRGLITARFVGAGGMVMGGLAVAAFGLLRVARAGREAR